MSKVAKPILRLSPRQARVLNALAATAEWIPRESKAAGITFFL